MSNGIAEPTLNLMRTEWLEHCSGRNLAAIRTALTDLEQHAPASQTVDLLREIRLDLAEYRSQDSAERRNQIQAAAERLKQLEPQLRVLPVPYQSMGKLPSALRIQPGKSTAPAATKPSLKPEDSVTKLRGVGNTMADRLLNLGIATIHDLLHHLPRSYVDFTKRVPIRDLNPMMGEAPVTIAGRLSEVNLVPGARKKRVEAILSDGTGWARLTWFNPFLAKQLHDGDEIVVHGPIDQFRGGLGLTGPEWQFTGRPGATQPGLLAIYPLTANIGQVLLRRLVREALDQTKATIIDPLPDSIRSEQHLMGLAEALRRVHLPEQEADIAQARSRLTFDEMFLLQMGLVQRKREGAAIAGNNLAEGRELVDKFMSSLPFPPTGAQQRAVGDVASDLCGPGVMQRLIQGDVGSGKTIVAAAAIVQAKASGFQAAVMAPTEILARQLYANLEHLLGPTTPVPARVAILTGSTKKRERAVLLAELEAGMIDVLVGTHALIQDGVIFNRLGLTVVDEQHRFGVRQRGELPSRGQVGPAHVLTMSATPIPRSLQMVLLGDIDVSVIDEMPPGRQPVITRRFFGEERERAYTAVRQEAAKGRQAFVICPLVEDSAVSEKRSAVAEAERLQREVFPNLRIDLLHGRMSGTAKDAVMRRFRDHDFDVLVATSVIEVGIDIPNATVMLIEGADQFGLSQLHQFRGRVGRGGGTSYCLLLADEATPMGEERLRMMESTTDGFALAEADLRLRGPGDFLGTRQSGLPDLEVLRTGGFDSRILIAARNSAEAILDRDPTLERPEHRLIRQTCEAFWTTAVSTFAGA